MIERMRKAVVNSREMETSPRLRIALLNALEEPIERVTSMARRVGCRRQALGKLWKHAFNGEPTAETFLRGLLLLRAIRLRARDPGREWVKIAGALRIESDRLRCISRALRARHPASLV